MPCQRLVGRLVTARLVAGLTMLVLVASACDAQPPVGRTRPVSTNEGGQESRDWPQWRGPNRDGISPDKDLLQEWPEGGPSVAWKATGIGEGFSSVSVAADRVYTMGDLSDACYVFAIDRQSGEIVWKAKVGKTGGNYKGPRSTPTVDGNRLYVLGQFGDLLCLEVASGEVVWRKNLVEDFKGRPGGWNYTESVLIDGEKLICTPGSGDAAMLALNKESGDVLWRGRTEEGDSAAYASPVVAEIGGVRQYVQLLSKGGASFAADDGKLLWRYGTRENRLADTTANIPTPIVQGDQVFFCAGYGRGGGMVRVTKSGDEFSADELWFNQRLQNKHGGVVWVGDFLYGDTDDRGLPWCADARTGDMVWQRRSRGEGSGSAAVTYADGNLYWRYQNGVVALVPVGQAKYEETSTFEIPMASDPSWPHPVVIGGRLYLRDQDNLWCHDVRKQ